MNVSNEVSQTTGRPSRRRLKIRAVEDRTGYSRQSIWRWYTNGNFPKPHYLGNDRCWFEDEIDEWERKRMGEREVIAS